MKKEVNPMMAAAAIVVLVIIVAIFIYRGSGGGNGSVAPMGKANEGPFAPGGAANAKMSQPPKPQ